MSESENYAILRGLLQNIANDVAKALNLPPETGDVAALKAECVKLRGTLRYVYEHVQAQAIAQGSREGNPFTEGAELEWKNLNSATVNYSADTQTIIGDDVNIPIPDMFK